MADKFLKYDFGEGVEAFSTGKDTTLPYEVVLGDQIHDIKTTVIRSENPSIEQLTGTDALVTNIRGVAIGVRTADCIPILLYDPAKQAIAAIHAGWKGTLRRIVNSCLSTMYTEYGSEARNIIAQIGPGISRESFQVGEEVAMNFKDLGFPIDLIYSWCGGKEDRKIETGHHIDLVAANKWLLEQAGVPASRIISCGIDTFTDSSFYSARRDGFDCGRNISVIKLV